MYGSDDGNPAGASTRAVMALVALALCASSGAVALAGPATAAKTKPIKVDAVEATAPQSAPGEVTPDGKIYTIVVPFFKIGVAHEYELMNDGKTVDSFSFTVPAEDGKTVTVKSKKGGTVKLMVNHTEGLNGSPSEGEGPYTPPPPPKKKKS